MFIYMKLILICAIPIIANEHHSILSVSLEPNKVSNKLESKLEQIENFLDILSNGIEQPNGKKQPCKDYISKNKV